MHILHKVFTCCLLLSFSPLYGQTGAPADTFYLFRFVSEKDMFYAQYHENETELERMFAFVEQHRREINEEQMSFYVDSYSTLLSTKEENLALARQRSSRVKSELITRKGLTESNFITRNHSQNGLERVTVRIQIPASERQKVVMTKGTEMMEKGATMPQEKPVERVVVEKRTVAESAPTSVISLPAHEATRQKEYSFALRANLLQWGMFTPHLGIEWRINPHIGMLVDGSWTSWSHNGGYRRYALWKVSPEIRYYIGKQQRGFLGAMYHVGEFNYKWGTVGKQGDYQGGGVTGGYQLPLNRSLSLDFHAGIGYTRFKYDEYRFIDQVRVRQANNIKNYWGINQLGITLVWKLVK